MTNKVSFSKDKIRSFAEEGKSVPDMASALNADLEELTQFYAECYEEDHDAFPLRLLVTKTWLDEKLKSEPVSHIARSVRATPRTIKNLMKVYGLKKEKLSDILTPEVLYTLFVVNGLTDKEIAKQYGCSIESIKKIRAKSNIVHSGRLEVGGGLSIEMFHKLYVEYGFTKTEIAKLMRYPYFRVNKIHSEFANSDHPLAASLKDAPRNYAFTDLINLLLDTVEPAVLFELLKDHTLAQVAEMYELIPPSEPGNEPFTPEWLDAQLKKMDIKEIISTYHIGSTFVHEMMKQGDMQRVPVQDRLDEETVRTLFVDKRWSEAKIAKALGTSVYAVARFESPPTSGRR